MTPRNTDSRRGMRKVLRDAVPLAFACALLASPAAAQTVRATVTDAGTGAPVAETLVRVEAADGSLLGAVFTRADGTAILRLRQRDAGTVRVMAQRGGFDPASQSVVVEARGTAGVQLRMAQRPFSMDTLEVIARSEDERGREGFERRRLMHDGVFLDSAYLDRRGGLRLADLVVDVPGLSTWAGPYGRFARTNRGWRCMVPLIDGRRVPTGEGRVLDQMIYPSDVVAMEVYREFDEVPAEYRIHARQGSNQAPCGVYVYWTRARW
jgi:hypothetical protein